MRVAAASLLLLAGACAQAETAGTDLRRALELAQRQAGKSGAGAEQFELAAALARAQGGSPRLGISPVDDRKGPGLGVAAVRAGSTGGLLGVQAGDRLVALDGAEVKTFADAQAWMNRVKVGDRIRLGVQRAGRRLELSGVMLGEGGTPAAAAAPAPAPEAPARPAPALQLASSDDEDVADPALESGATLRPWTDIQRRSVQNNLLPSATTIPAGDWYVRVSHVSTQAIYDDWQTNLLGLDDSVKIGIMVGYGLAKNFDITIQRVNGGQLQVDPAGSEPVNFDYYDIMGRWKVLDQYDGALASGGLADIAVTAGITDMFRNRGRSEWSLNLGILVERLFFDDRLRLGTGLVRSGLSAYERSIRLGPPTKLSPDEQDALSAAGTPPSVHDEAGTTAIPLNVKIALNKRWQIFGEAIYPIAGYSTGFGPTLLGGVRLNTNTHEYSFFLSNTANASFNSVITGGNARYDATLFGFNINVYF